MKWYKNLRVKIWLYFLIFTALILLLLLLFQVVFLQTFYENMKTKKIEATAKQLVTHYGDEDFQELLQDLTKENSLSIMVYEVVENDQFYEFRKKYYSNSVGENSIFGSQSFDYKEFCYELLSQNDGILIKTYERKIMDKVIGNDILMGVTITEDAQIKACLFINASLMPLDSSVEIFKEQLVYITIILFFLAFVISFYISRNVSRPIANITKSAKEFAKGNYDVQFKGEGYDEVEQLAKTLNIAAKEVHQVESLRRDLIANISHDLRTPLTMVKAYAEMIRDLSGDNPAKRQEHINVIIEEADRLTNLVSDILNISKLESGADDIKVNEFEINSKIHEIMSRYTLLAETEGYTFTFEEDKEIIVLADETKIEQVIYNLINNAVNYAGEDRAIIVRQKNLPDRVRIEISDNGVGIEKELLPVIFDRYYRAEKTKRDVVGTGLGLSIVKNILKNHNFPFGVQSVLGEGSTFWFEILLDK